MSKTESKINIVEITGDLGNQLFSIPQNGYHPLSQFSLLT